MLKAGRPDSSSATTSPSITVSSGSVASALTTAGYLELKSLLFRDRRCTLPRVLSASALQPCNFSSYAQLAPSGNVCVGESSIGSRKVAFDLLRGHGCSLKPPRGLPHSRECKWAWIGLPRGDKCSGSKPGRQISGLEKTTSQREAFKCILLDQGVPDRKSWRLRSVERSSACSVFRPSRS